MNKIVQAIYIPYFQDFCKHLGKAMAPYFICLILQYTDLLEQARN